jgi:hypothetical protein
VLNHCGTPLVIESVHRLRESRRGETVSREYVYRCKACGMTGYRERFDPDPVIDAMLRSTRPGVRIQSGRMRAPRQMAS